MRSTYGVRVVNSLFDLLAAPEARAESKAKTDKFFHISFKHTCHGHKSMICYSVAVSYSELCRFTSCSSAAMQMLTHKK